MKLLVDRLTDSPNEVAFSATPGWWRERGRLGADVADLLQEPIEFRVSAHRMGADVYLEGDADGVLELTCSRCLGRYRHPIRERFRLVLEPAGVRVPADPEGAAALARDGLSLADELESGWFRGPELDLGSFMQEVVALLLPVQPVCREDCRGLCPQCGRDRNADPCQCSATTGSSPFAALGALRDQLDRRRNRW